MASKKTLEMIEELKKKMKESTEVGNISLDSFSLPAELPSAEYVKPFVTTAERDMVSYRTGVDLPSREVNGYTVLSGDAEEPEKAEWGAPHYNEPEPEDAYRPTTLGRQSYEIVCTNCFLITREELAVDGVCASCQ